MGMKQTVNVHIGELVLHGFPPSECRRIAPFIEQELARLILKQGLPQRFRNPVSLERVNGGVIHLRSKRDAASTGVGISRAIYRSFRQQQRGTKQ